MEARRIHHQLVPMRIEYEEGLDPEVLNVLQKVGHKLKQGPIDGFASVTAIFRHMGPSPPTGAINAIINLPIKLDSFKGLASHFLPRRVFV